MALALSRIDQENKRLQDLQYKIDLRQHRAQGRRDLPDLKQFDVVSDELENFVRPTTNDLVYSQRKRHYINDNPLNIHDVEHIFNLIKSKFNTRASTLIWKDRHNNIHINPVTQQSKIQSRIIINLPLHNKAD
jgi:hypothetical protein